MGSFFDINTNFLENNKIRRIINCSFQFPKFVDLRNYKYHNIRIYDSPDQEIITKIDKVYEILNEEKKSTLINCYAGVSRSATIVIGILMRKYGWSLDKSFDHVSKRRNIDPNNGFMMQLQKYEKICKKRKEEREKNIKKIEKELNTVVDITKLFNL